MTHGNRRHGMSETPEYYAWNNMLQRCYKPHNPKYRDYGGRGISVCPEWHTFENFYRDMGKRPVGLSLDRIDNNGNYSKENCRWTTGSEQVANSRLRKTSTSGLKGVSAERNGRVHAYHCPGKQLVTLYRGTDFFEACCARKSWEASQ